MIGMGCVTERYSNGIYDGEKCDGVGNGNCYRGRRNPNMLLKITLPLMHVNVSPQTESGWTRKNTDCCEQVRANTDDRAGSGSKRRKISTSETSPVGVATKIARKYRRMHHTRSPLSTTARRLLLNKLHVGESRSVDLSSHCHHTSSAFLSSREPEYPEL